MFLPSTFSQKKIANTAFRGSFASFFSKAGFGAGFQQAELGIGEAHLLADFLLRLFEQIKTSEHLAVAARHGAQNALHDAAVLGTDGRFLGAQVATWNPGSRFAGEVFAAGSGGLFDELGDSPANNGAGEGEEAFRFAQFASLDGLDDEQEGIVDAVVDLMTPKLADDQNLDAPRDEFVELFEGGFLILLDAADELGPIDAGSGIGGRRRIRERDGAERSLEARQRLIRILPQGRIHGDGGNHGLTSLQERVGGPVARRGVAIQAAHHLKLGLAQGGGNGAG